MSLADLIEHCVAAKSGDQEFMLYRVSENDWEAHIGNTSAVMLGEVSGEFTANGRTAEEAVAALLAKLQAVKPPPSNEPGGQG